jgi:hypothetical protein
MFYKRLIALSCFFFDEYFVQFCADRINNRAHL